MTDWDQRQLCPDGGCLGLIGSDGTCKVCGKASPNWGDERRRGLAAEAADQDETSDDDDVDEDDAREDAASEDDDNDGDDGDDSDDADDDGDDDVYGDNDEDDDEDDDVEGEEDGAIAAKSEAGGDKSGGAKSTRTTESGADRAMKSAAGWTDRALCPDGGCIGVIGDNGTCKVCGKSAA